MSRNPKSKRKWAIAAIAFVWLCVIVNASTLALLISLAALIGAGIYYVRTSQGNLASLAPETKKQAFIVLGVSLTSLALSISGLTQSETRIQNQASNAPQNSEEINQPAAETAKPVEHKQASPASKKQAAAATAPNKTTKPKPQVPADTTPLVKSGQILKDYENNKIAAEQKYKGKTFKISGVVGSIGETFGQMYITIGTGATFEVTQLQCGFDSSFRDKLAKLNKGSKITVKGTIADYIGNITVTDCSF